MEVFLYHYYPIKIVVCAILIGMLSYRRKILPHAKALIIVLSVPILISCIKLYFVETFSYYTFSVKSLIYCSLGISCIGGFALSVLLPGWFSIKKVLLTLLFPLLIAVVIGVSLLMHVDFYLYNSFEECLEDICEYQIWIRLVLLGLLWIQFLVFVFLPKLLISHFKSPLWYRVYLVHFFLYLFIFVVTFYQNSRMIDVLLNIYLMVSLFTICMLEMYTDVLSPQRIKVTSHIQEDYEDYVRQVDLNHPDFLQEHALQFFKIEELVMSRSLYTNPNLSIEDLAYEAHETTRHIDKILRAAGYASFSHFIAKCRIVRLKELLLQSYGRNILNLYTVVGFRNRVSASKCFKLYEGITPTEWVKQEMKSLYPGS